MSPESHFSPDYSTARSRFREAGAKAGGRLDILPLDVKGPRGDDLSIEVGWFGSDTPDRVLIHSSGLHGVEGFAGSAIQLQLLASLPTVRPSAALAVVHCLNPFGMAWLRRVNENNIDLNRNFLEGESYSGAPAGYAALDAFLNPQSPPSWDFYLLKAAMLIGRHGMPSLRQAVAGGQYDFPRGLFFGGKQLAEGPRKYRQYLADRLKSVHSAFVIDVHTGLGKYAEDTLLVDLDKVDRMRRLYGDRVAPLEPQKGPAYRVRGGLHSMFGGIASRADVQFIGQEFGTYNSLKVLRALRAENRWHHYGAGTLDHAAKRNLLEAFNPQDTRWQAAVLRRGQLVLEQTWRQANE